jgi:hypothetical protein
MTPVLSHSASPLRRLRGFPSPLALLLLLAFVVQVTAVQSHVHFIEHANPLASASHQTRIQSTSSSQGESTADCPLCQEAAFAGAYLLPHLPVLPPPPAPAPWLVLLGLAAFGLAVSSFGWLSRAPPE